MKRAAGKNGDQAHWHRLFCMFFFSIILQVPSLSHVLIMMLDSYALALVVVIIVVQLLVILLK
jgi:hypothetical protein